MLNKGKIRYIDKDEIYYIVSKNDLLSNFTNDVVVGIDVQYIPEGNKVFV